jgi:hypothetical protein
LTSRPDPRLGTELGPYRIETVIGRGGMGVVYLATDVRLDRRVGLKLLSPELADDASFRARFLRESRLAASIDDPNIIPVYEAGDVDGLFYIAMRYVEGTDLETRLSAGPLAPADVMPLLAQVASALDAAHERGLVHRDVKPANILIAAGKGPGRPDHAYLTDFGLTKHRGSQTGVTRAGAFLGTLDYIAPEQIEGKPLDGRADQYALACMAFQCLTGSVPFKRDSDPAIMMAHLRDAPPSASALESALGTQTDAVLIRGMAKKPEDRFTTCEAFVAALRQALGVRPTEERAVLAATSRRVWPALVAATVVLILVGGGLWLGNRGVTTGPSLSPTAPASAVAEATPTADASFPNAEEAALLKVMPSGIKDHCLRHANDIVYMSGAGGLGGGGARIPFASLSCAQPAGAGADLILVREFNLFDTDDVITRAAAFKGIPSVDSPDDCATKALAAGRWLVAGRDVGAFICFVDGSTGEANLWWSYTNTGVLASATKANGGAAALVRFFDQYARFIGP